MENNKLKLEKPWDEVKGMLQEIAPELSDEDLEISVNGEAEMLKRVAQKLQKDVPSVKGWIESVSHNNGLAY